MPQALAASDAGMELIDRRPHLLSASPTSILLIGGRSLAFAYSGRLDEAEELSSRALEAARAAGRSSCFANGYRAHALLSRGRLPEALRYARRALEKAETVESPLSRAAARVNCGSVASLLALWAEGEQWGEEGVAILRAHHVGMQLEPLLLTFWAEGLAFKGDHGRARELVGEAIDKAQSFGAGVYQFRAHLGHARVLRAIAAPADAGGIKRALQLAEERAVEIGLAGWLPWVYEERAALALALGDEARHRTHLAEARRLYEAIGAAGHLERLAERAQSARPD